jgi:O-acetyl-ADP-ribose deacetylase (regulator of RNase III)
MKRQLHKATLEIIQGDLLERDEDAIVNPSTPNLVLTKGFGPAIRQRGGKLVAYECQKKAPVHVGEAVVTTAGDLKARFVIHAVGPKWGEGQEDEKLRMTVFRAMRVADQNGFKSLAIPPISTGEYGFPVRRAAEIMLNTVVRYLNNQSSLRHVTIILADQATCDLFIEVAEGMEAAGVLPTVPVPPGELGLGVPATK